MLIYVLLLQYVLVYSEEWRKYIFVPTESSAAHTCTVGGGVVQFQQHFLFIEDL